MIIQPRVVDLSHYQSVTDLNAAKRAGLVGVIHKASEGVGYHDDKYVAHRTLADQAGLLWGAYHFLRPGNMVRQASFFVNCARPDQNTLMAADHEDTGVSVNDLVDFMKAVEDLTQRFCVLYSGFLIREQLNNSHNDYLASRRLWLAQYAAAPRVPPNWANFWLWQFTGDGHGPSPHTIPGIVGSGLDINHYDGTAEQLTSEWAGLFSTSQEERT